METADWNNSAIIGSDLATEVGELKDRHGKDILVNGSAMLVGALAEQNLVDEYRLMVFPVVLGAGKRLFSELGGQKPMIYEDGLQQRDFVHVSDIVQACALAIDNPAADYAAGLDWGRRAVRQTPDLVGGWRALALSAAMVGHQEEAQEAVTRARQLQPDYSVAWVQRESPLVHAPDRARYCDILRRVGLPEE